MKATDTELGTLLTLERRNLIPTYQRDYEWTEEGQWQLLMDDIVDVADRLMEARDIAVGRGGELELADDSVGPHFLGAVVFEGLPHRGAHVATCAVIDGQQRLTTIYLLMRGLLDVLTEHELTRRSRQVRKMLLIDQEDVIDEYEVFKLWPRRRDRGAWETAMLDKQASGTHRHSEARRYFADRIRAAVEGLPGEIAGHRLEALVDALTHKIKIVVVDLESSDDPQLIFEVLNGRQTPLSASDLVKNLLFMRADITEKDLDELYDKYWSAFDDEWWSGSIGRGHASRGRRDQLLATWLTIQTADEVNLGRLYGEARAYLGSTQTKLPEILEDISDLAREYRRIYERPDAVAPAIGDVYRRMEKLGVTTAVPLLAWLRTLPTERLTESEHESAVAAVDSFVMRRLIVAGQTRGYGRAFLEVLQKAKITEPGVSIATAIEQSLLSSPYGLDWPTDAEIETEFLSRTFYGRISQERIRMVLSPIDRLLQSQRPKSEQASFDYDELTIEHIMPRSWQTHWPVEAQDDATKFAAEQERERHLHRIGNLTLVTQAFNSGVSNEAWNVKRQELIEHSQLALNTRLSKSADWNEALIDSRARDLAAAACVIWSRPPTVGDDED